MAMTTPSTNQFRRGGAGASRKARAERDAPRRLPIVKLVMAEILARQFRTERAGRPSIVDASARPRKPTPGCSARTLQDPLEID
jgi:hypothetical protein